MIRNKNKTREREREERASGIHIKTNAHHAKEWGTVSIEEIPDGRGLNYHRKHQYGAVAFANIPPNIRKYETNSWFQYSSFIRGE